MTRPLREVVYVDGVRTAFGRAGPDGLLREDPRRRHGGQDGPRAAAAKPVVPPERIGDVVIAATAQVGDQGLTLGRDVALLAGLPHTVPGFAVDRMCAGALTGDRRPAPARSRWVRGTSSLAGGVEHMGHHPMGAEVDFNPRFVAERLIDESAAVDGPTAENLHDRFPQLTKARCRRVRRRLPAAAAAAWENGVMARPSSRWPCSPTTAGRSRTATSSCGRTRRSRRSPPARRRSARAAG